MSSEKNDVFVGNVTFNTTEEQLRDIFGVVGAIKNIRILQDKETGRPKGFAFIEYMDANTALAAIRNLDGTELNGRRLRVSYSNNSNLREMAKLIGQDVTEVTTSRNDSNQAVSNLQLYEAWDILDLLKKMADEDRGDKIRQLLEGYPQLVGAVNQIQKRLGIVSNAQQSDPSQMPQQGLPHPAHQIPFQQQHFQQAPNEFEPSRHQPFYNEAPMGDDDFYGSRHGGHGRGGGGGMPLRGAPYSQMQPRGGYDHPY